jgi:hypothetical protein
MKQLQNKRKTIFVVQFEREKDGRWIAEIPNLPGVMAYGRTKSESQRRAYAIALRSLADQTEYVRTPSVVSRFFNHELA